MKQIEQITCPGCHMNWTFYPPVRTIKRYENHKPVYDRFVRCIECKRVYDLPVAEGVNT